MKIEANGQRLVVHLLRPIPPYDLAKAWEFLANSEGVAPSAQRRTLIRAWMLRGKPVAVRLEDIGTMNSPALEAELLEGDEHDWPVIEASLRRSLSLDVDLAPLHRAAELDPAFRALLDQTRGYRMVCLPTPFEAAVWAVLKQNTFGTIARANWRKLQETFGTTVTVDGREVPCFPDATQFLGRTMGWKLRSLRLRKKHVEYLRNAAELFANELSDDENAGLAPEGVRAMLAATPGFGPWSVQFISMRGYGYLDQATVLAPSVLAKARRVYDQALTPREAREIMEGYEPYSAYWIHLLRAFGPAEPKAAAAKKPRARRAAARSR